MNNNKKKLFIVGGISLALIAVLGITYAWLTQALNGTKVNKITAGTLELVLDDTTSDGIDLQYAVPQTDQQGLNNQAYTFKVINNGSINAKYSIYLEDEELENGLQRMSDSNIKFDLVKNGEGNNPRLLSSVVSDNKRVLDNNIVINGGATNEYTLRLWIDQEATTEQVSGKVFAAKIKIEAIQTDEINGYLVKYNANGGTGTMTDSINTVVTNTFTAPKDRVFKEWNTSSDGTGDTYTTESTISNNLTLYAIWKPFQIVRGTTVGTGDVLIINSGYETNIDEYLVNGVPQMTSSLPYAYDLYHESNSVYIKFKNGVTPSIDWFSDCSYSKLDIE